MATWVGSPSTTAMASTPLGGITGKMVVNQAIGVTAQNAPFTSQPNWVGAPRNISLDAITLGQAAA